MTREFRRGLLLTLAGSIGAAALLSAFALVFGAWRVWVGQTVGTAITIAYFSLMCFLCSLPTQTRPARLLAPFGLVAAGAACAWSVLLIWAAAPLFDNDLGVKIEFTALILGTALPVAAALLVPRLQSVGRLVQAASVAGTCLVCVWGLAMMWTELDIDVLYRLLSAAIVLTSAGVVATPLLARFYSIKPTAELHEVTATLEVKCPRCLTTQELPVGESRCRICRLRFKLEVEEPRCPGCGYILRGLTRPVCPECGRPLAPDDLAQPQPA